MISGLRTARDGAALKRSDPPSQAAIQGLNFNSLKLEIVVGYLVLLAIMFLSAGTLFAGWRRVQRRSVPCDAAPF